MIVITKYLVQKLRQDLEVQLWIEYSNIIKIPEVKKRHIFLNCNFHKIKKPRKKNYLGIKKLISLGETYKEKEKNQGRPVLKV